MYQVIIVIHIILGLAIIGLILMQQGKGADAGATFGGGASGSVFGAQGAASFLSRTTAILAALFFATSLGLAWLNSNKSATVSDIMGSTAVEKEIPDLGLPPVDGTNNQKPLPAPAENKALTPPTPPVTDTPTAPAVPDAAPVPQADQPKVETAPVPQADQPKVDDAPVVVEEPAVVEEKESELTPEAPAKTPENKLPGKKKK